jgi:hypothetical protein
MTGPDGLWFGIGFDAKVMQERPYTIIVDGYGNVTERRLGNHMPGTNITSTITVLSNDVKDSIRTVVMKRDMVLNEPKLKGYYNFTLNDEINIISAVGIDQISDFIKVMDREHLNLLQLIQLLVFVIKELIVLLITKINHIAIQKNFQAQKFNVQMILQQIYKLKIILAVN